MTASTVRIDWGPDFDTNERWDQVCIWAIETYGLPGHRFTYSPNVNYMEFHFPDQRDATVMLLRWGGRIISNNEVTLDFIGKKINGIW